MRIKVYMHMAILLVGLMPVYTNIYELYMSMYELSMSINSALG
jgi:hypothetical protein